jgi:hypothetical protein
LKLLLLSVAVDEFDAIGSIGAFDPFDALDARMPPCPCSTLAIGPLAYCWPAA